MAGATATDADCGKSNCRSSPTGQVGRFASLTIPPGTSKWNKIEHRLFCQITANWRGRPLTSYQAVVDLIGATTTSAGLKVHAYLDPRVYEKGRDVSDDEMAELRIRRDSFHGEWNYTFLPRLEK